MADRYTKIAREIVESRASRNTGSISNDRYDNIAEQTTMAQPTFKVAQPTMAQAYKPSNSVSQLKARTDQARQVYEELKKKYDLELNAKGIAYNPGITPEQRNELMKTMQISQDTVDRAGETYRKYLNAYTEASNAEKKASYESNRNNANFNSVASKGEGVNAQSIFTKSYAEAMTPEQQDIYNYLYSTNGQKSADDYFSTIANEVNARRGAEIASKYNANDATRAVGGLANSTVNFFDNLRDLSSEVRPVSAYEYANQNLANNIETGVGKVAFDVASNIGNMAPSMAAGFIPVVGPYVAAGTLGLTAGADAYQSTRREGYTPEEAAQYGFVNGLSEAALQYALGGIEAMGGKLTGNAIKNAAKSIKNPVAKALTRYGAEAGSEFTEEYLQEVLDPVFRNITLKENNEVKLVSEDALYAGLLGALTAGALNSTSVIREKTFKSKETKLIGKTINQNENLRNAFKEVTGKELSNDYTIGKEVTNALKTNEEAVVANIRAELKGVKNAEAVAQDIFNEAYANVELPRTSRSIIANSNEATRVRNAVRAEAQNNEVGTFATEAFINTRNFASTVHDALINNTIADMQKNNVADMQRNNVIEEGTAEAIEPMEAAIDNKSIARVNDEIAVRNEDGTVTRINETEFDNDNTAKVFNDSVKFKEYPNGSEVFVDSYRGQNAAEYNDAFSHFVNLGKQNAYTFEEALNVNQGYTEILGKETAKKAFELAREEYTKQSVEKPKKAGSYKNESENHNLDSLFEAVAEKTGLDIKISKDESERGSFNAKLGALIINADEENKLGTLAHELSHYGFEYNSKEMKSVRDNILKWFTESEGANSLEEMIGRYAKEYPELTYNEVIEEVVADAMNALFTSDSGVANFAEWAAKNKSDSWWESFIKVCEAISKWIKDFIKGNPSINPATRKALEMEADKAREIRKQFLKVLDTAEGGTEEGTVRQSKIVEDSEGNKLTEAQQEYFKDSKIVNDKGNLKVMYHLSPNDFTVFDIKKASYAGHFGRGFYFADTELKEYGGKTYKCYLDIKSPISWKAGEATFTEEQLRNYITAIAENEDFGIENYGEGYTVDDLVEDFLGQDNYYVLNDLNSTCIGDFVAAVKLFNEVNGTNYDGIEAATETVAFYPEQIKLTTNENPTSNPDIRYAKKIGADGIEEYILSDDIKKMNYKERKRRLREMVTNEFKGRTVKLKIGNQVHYASFGKNEVDKNIYADNKSDPDGYDAKIAIGADGNYIDLIENSNYIDSNPESGKNKKYHKDAKTWDYFDKTIKFGEDYFDVFINVKDNGNEKFAYLIELKKAATAPDRLRPESGARAASEKNIKQKAQNVNTQERKSKSVEEELSETKEKLRKAEKEVTISKGKLDEDSHIKLANKIRTKFDLDKAKISMQEIRVDTLAIARMLYESNSAADAENMAKALAQKLFDKVAQRAPQETKADRDYLRKFAFSLSEDTINELKTAGVYNEFLRRAIGKLRYNRGALTLGRKAGELEHIFPGISDIANETDLVEALLERTENLYTPFEVEKGGVIDWMTDEILKSIEELPEDVTFADRKRTQIRKIREDRDQKLKNQAERFREMAKERRDREARTAFAAQKRKKIIKNKAKLSEALRKPTKTLHVIEPLRGAMIKALNAIELTMPNKSSAAGRDAEESFRNLVRVLRENNEAVMNASDNAADYADIIAIDTDYIESAERMADIIAKRSNNIYNMTSEELEELDALLTALISFNDLATNEQALRATAKAKNVAAKYVVNTPYKDRKNTVFTPLLTGLDKLVNNEFLDLRRWSERLEGEAGKYLWSVLDKGNKQTAANMRTVKKFFESLNVKTKPYNEETEITFTNGATKKMTRAQMMSLYLLSKRPDAQGHLYGEGIIFKNPFGSAENYSRPISLTIDDVARITDMLTKEEKALADKLQSFLATTAADWGNEVTMELWGYKGYKDKNYFPIYTKKAHEHITEAEAKEPGKRTGAETANKWALRNKSFTHNTVDGAKNAIVVDDIFDVFTRHSAEMAQYNGFAVPLTQVMAMRGFKEGNSNFYETLRNSLGENGVKYLDNLIDDLNGSSLVPRGGNILNAAMGMYQASAVAGNIRVIVQQPTAIFRALAEIDGKYLLKGMAKPIGTKTQEEMKEHSSLAFLKSEGIPRENVARSAREIITGETAGKNNFTRGVNAFKDLTMKGSNIADDLAWTTLWNACKAEVTDKTGLTSGDEYFKKVTDRFDEIVNATQVFDTILSRTQIMRHHNPLMKMATAFMSEPMRQFNMGYSAIRNFIKEPTKANGTKIVRTLSSMTFSIAMTCVAKSLVDGLRDDDKDDYLESVVKNFQDNLKDDMDPLTMLPYVKDIVSVLQGYTPARLDTAALSQVQKAINVVGKVANGESNYTPYGAVYECARALSATTGIPFGNIMRDVNAVIQTVFPGVELTKYGSQKDKLAYINTKLSTGADVTKEFNEWANNKAEELKEKGYKGDELTNEVIKSARSSLRDIFESQYEVGDATERKAIESRMKRYTYKGQKVFPTEKQGNIKTVSEYIAGWKEKYK